MASLIVRSVVIWALLLRFIVAFVGYIGTFMSIKLHLEAIDWQNAP